MTALPPTILSALKAGDVKSFATIPATGESGLKVEQIVTARRCGFFNPQNAEERNFVMLSKEELYKRIEDALGNAYPQYEFTQRECEKNNQTIDVLIVRDVKSPVAPSLNLTDWYERYSDGDVSVEDVITHLVAIIEDAFTGVDTEALADAAKEAVKNWKKSARFSVVKKEGNERYLAGKATTDFLDLVKEYYVPVEIAGGVVRVVITEDIFRDFGCTIEELDEIALKNTIVQDAPVWTPIEEVLREMIAQELHLPIELIPVEAFQVGFPMYVVTTTSQHLGAGMMLYSSVLEAVLDDMNAKEMWIAPSSTHEIICVPVNCGITLDGISEIVSTVNREALPAQEILSGSVYRFAHGDNAVSIAA